MLPTTGFFKDIDCPYYYDSTCGRPYCHFRHRKRNQDSEGDSQDGTEAKPEVPTYNPTPKSQLQQARSHIPISYVPDIVVRTERSYRNPPTYSLSDKLTYNPTPLSELTKTIKTNASLVEDDDVEQNAVDEPYDIVEPEVGSNGNDINFEELSTEFDVVDDIINEESIAEISNNNLPSSDDTKVDSRETTSKESKEDRSFSKNEHKSRKSKSSSSGKSEKHSSRNDSKTDKSKDRKHKEDSSKSRRSSTTKDSEKNSSSKSDIEKSSLKSSSSKTREEHSKSSNKSKDSEKSKHKDKHRSKDKTNEMQKKDDKKTKDKEKSSHRESKEKHKESKSKDRSKSKHDSKHGEKSKSSKEKEIKKSKSASVNEEKIFSDPEDPGVDIFMDNFDDEDDTKYTSVEEECFRIFNEYKPEPINPPDPLQKEAQAEYIPTPKKRIAHQGADNYTPKLFHAPPKPSQNPGLAMMNRFKAAKLAQANNEQSNIFGALRNIKRSHSEDEDSQSSERSTKMPKITVPKEKPKKENVSLSIIDDIINGTTSQYVPSKAPSESHMKAKVKKIAPVQNINLFQQAKAKAELAKRNAAATKTPMQTVGKGNKRVAHVPDMSMGDLPDVLQPDNKKIPINVRTRYLTMIADECLKLYLLKNDAYERALNEELKVVERCAAVITYRNSAMLTVNRLRKELQERNAKGLGPISADDVEDSDKDSQFKGKKFYANIMQYTLTEEDLDVHGYPREGPIPGKAIIKTQKQMPKVNLNPNQRLCCRCFKVYMVDERGIPSYEEECIYHPLKKRTIRGDRIYLCCKSSEDGGCVTANTHVCETEAELEGYQTTMEPERENDPRSVAVYALDCEMCYTTKGLELTRVTVVDSQCKTVYESLVKPLNPIIDYNTQFSGITKDQMDRTSTSILQVQANILHLCNSRTILIGHSLESDMKALKIIHSNIIDTAVLFPHRLGLPFKKALRVLASEFLKKIIQSNVNGHDSAEDALTCMELVMWKLKEDLKTRSVK